MLSSRRRIVRAGDVAIEDLSGAIDDCVSVTVGDMVGRLDTVEAIERSAVALAILITTRWVTAVKSHGVNLFIPEEKGTGRKLIVAIMRVGGEPHVIVVWRKPKN